MTQTSPTPAEIRAYRAANPKLRERDIAAQLDISEAALVAAECGLTAIRIDGDANRFLERAAELGEVMALTRNESAVHEKIGVFENITPGKHASIVLGENIDLRIFPGAWAHGFAVTKTDGDDVRRSLQFFDKQGTAVHKIHLRAASNLDAYNSIVEAFRLEDQSQEFAAVAAVESISEGESASVDVAVLRDEWSRMTDTHQFHVLLRKLKLERRQALEAIGEDFAWKLQPSAVEDMMRESAKVGLPIMCFIGNHGVIQIHSGPVANIQTMGPWLNVMDPTFHMHLRTDHLAEVWAVRKPTTDGHVTSLEALDAKGEMVVQFFGKRKEGNAERDDWRTIMENLARLDITAAA
ncbi:MULTISPECIES: hemin-degrading factor [unclassified Rhizobium]|uniref:hemin-degrading factor n=1 Tax=unclassified Rhizobium TaxID=2613769 RepID=UPI0007137EFE|nr:MULTISPECIES: hemin-degrading factor [unclassified Rhizobium]KQS84736.1 iron transporter [Rhizobium sp. Leaf386]KQT05263.1 iron transporter [Rhizobium sp. Leaf391]KQT91705.1 iron transporter [Rhizobium sp. Leaf453]